ncbi:hypothetical protein IGI04_002048 [Brassica rapa subsp. trilocularis]|uniref:Uncharacterized protein n=1 Tax=Brassica rapa subsp. trilocularis TaxID=1813537 RepID=A0ABQ7NUE5_BRACM|nr:hypothetical protein IGI04_002048 [Brassica rapa subsp. trilocularis]
MHFMLENFPRNLEEVFQSLLPKVVQILDIFFRSKSDFENFSEDSWKTPERLLGKSSNVFYARRLSAKSSGSLPKSFAQGVTEE